MNIISLQVPKGKNIFSKLYFFYLRIRRLKKLKARLGITHSISHLEGADYINILSKKREHVICWVHGTKMSDRNIEGLAGLLRLKFLIPELYRRSDGIICVSDGIKKEIIGQFGIRDSIVETIVNGFDIAQIDRRAQEPPLFPVTSITQFGPVLITHCRLARQKNLTAMIEIVSIVRKTHDVTLMIVGDGELRHDLVSAARSLGLRTFAHWEGTAAGEQYDVCFCGFFQNPFSLLKHATLYLLVSSWEGFPLSLGEAMACGLPVLASDCFTGPREMIAPEISSPAPIIQPLETTSGILMPLADTNESRRIWAHSICTLLDNDKKRMAFARGARHRIADFDIREIQSKWLTIVHE